MNKYPNPLKVLFGIGIGLCGFLWVSQAHAAITFDASSSVGFSGTSVISTSLTIGGGCSNPLLVLLAETGANASSVAISGGTATSAISFTVNSHGIDVWYMIAPSTGLHNATVTYSATRSGGVGMESYCGVNQTSPLDKVSTSTVLLKMAVTSTITTAVANDVLVDEVGRTAESTETPFNASQVVLIKDTGNTNKIDSSYYLATSTQAYILGWNYTASNVNMAYGIAAFKPFVAAGGTTPRRRIIVVDNP